MFEYKGRQENKFLIFGNWTLSFGEDGGDVEDWRMGSGGDINTGEAEPSNSPPPSSTRSRLSLSSALLHGHTS